MTSAKSLPSARAAWISRSAMRMTVELNAPARPRSAGDDHDADLVDLVDLTQQRMVDVGPGRGEVADDLGDVLAVGPRLVGPLLGLDHAGRRDELHGARDLLGVLDARDLPTEDPFLCARHGVSWFLAVVSPTGRGSGLGPVGLLLGKVVGRGGGRRVGVRLGLDARRVSRHRRTA